MRDAYLAMDDDPPSLSLLVDCLRQANGNAEIRACGRIADALGEIRKGYRPKAAFLDVDMNASMTGIELARIIRQVSPATDVVFVTAHGEYVMEFYALRAAGFILKPVTTERIREELACLPHHPVIGGTP